MLVCARDRKKHGDMRVTVKEKAKQCPYCGEPAHCYVLGRGGTRRGRAVEVEPETNFRFESYSNVGL